MAIAMQLNSSNDSAYLPKFSALSSVIKVYGRDFRVNFRIDKRQVIVIEGQER